MASTLGERVGETVGLRMRLETKVSAKTRIEVVTEGVFARLILDDPSLADVAAVLFDEFHERSLDADLGLALALDAQSGLRDDLRLLVMSATLDGISGVVGFYGRATQRSDGGSSPVEEARGVARLEEPFPEHGAAVGDEDRSERPDDEPVARGRTTLAQVTPATRPSGRRAGGVPDCRACRPGGD